MDTPPPEERFKITILQLLDYIKILSEEYSQPLGLIGVIKIGLNTISSNDLVENFIKKTYDNWEKIRIKDTDYFINLSEVFLSEVNSNKEEYADSPLLKCINIGKETSNFKTLLSKLDDDDKDTIWSGIHPLIKQSISYMKQNREKFNNIDINSEIKIWNIK